MQLGQYILMAYSLNSLKKKKKKNDQLGLAWKFFPCKI